MKITKFTLLLLSAGFSIAAYAQTPIQQTKSVVFEFSDTWCTPCGAYAVDVADSLEAQMILENKGYLIGVKTTSTPSSLNAICGNIMWDNFAVDAVPSFIINSGWYDDGCTHDNAGDVARMMGKVSTFDSQPAVGGIAAITSVTGNIITVTAKSKFWNATTGNYYMSVMLTEDDISATQTAYPNNPCIHTNVLRGAMATSGTALAASPWGESVGTSAIAAGQEFTKTYSVAIDPGWDASKLAAFAIIFRQKTVDTFEIVNVEKSAGTATGIGEISSLKEISVYPNPADDMINIAIDAAESLKADTRIADAQGRIVYSQKDMAVNKGANKLQISTSGLASGYYMITISGDKMGAITRSVVIR